MDSLPEGYTAFPNDNLMNNAKKIGLTILLALSFPFVTLMLLLFILCTFSMVHEVAGDNLNNITGITSSIIEFIFYVLGLLYLSIYIWILIKIWFKQAALHRKKIWGILGLYAIATAAMLWYLNNL